MNPKKIFLFEQGWFKETHHVVSPNQGERPSGMNIDTLIIHNISLPPGQYDKDYVTALFTNQLNFEEHPYFQTLIDCFVSAHFYVRRSGMIIQYVPTHKKAWHAGVSSFQGRENCNDFSIGIEVEGADTSPFERIQYEQLAALIFNLQQVYPTITRDRIIGHSDVAPGRKTDPGPCFDWNQLWDLI